MRLNVKMWLFSLLIVLVAAGNPAFVRHEVPFDGVLAMSISAPPAWGVVMNSGCDVNSHRNIQIAINSKELDSLVVGPLREDMGQGQTRWTDGGPDVFTAVLSPGTVYLEVWVFSGGPPAINVPYAWREEDRLESTIRAATGKRKPAWEDDRVIGYEFGFVHWGQRWGVTICGRKPFTRHDLDAAFEVLRSIRLDDIPVGDPRQAIEVTLPFVPEDIRRAAVAANECCGGRYQVEAVTTGAGFDVVVDILDAEQPGVVMNTARLRVARDGTVTEVRE